MDALLLIDLQNDFLNPKGTLYCPGGETLAEKINQWMNNHSYDLIIASQDFHPPKHISFASTHGGTLFTTIKTKNGDQIMWPEHCIQYTWGCELVASLNQEKINVIWRKGAKHDVDSYSAFYDKAGEPTGLGLLLNGSNIDVAGVATDVCVCDTVSDAARWNNRIRVLADLCVGVTPENHLKALQKMATWDDVLIFWDNL